MNETVCKLTLTAILSSIALTFQWYLPMLIIFTGSILIDYLTGIAKAFFKGEVNSGTSFKGIIKKLLYFVVIACGFMVDFLIKFGLSYINIDVPSMASVGVTTTVLLTINELISIIENLSEIEGIPIPNVLKNALKKIKDLTDKSE